MKNLSPIRILLYIQCIFLSSVLSGQTDCKTAIPICDLGSYYYAEIKGAGQQDVGDLSFKDFEETNSKWYSWEVQESGNFDFVIIPDSPEDDLDFVLYKTVSNCANLIPIREMYSDLKQNGNNETGLNKVSQDDYEHFGQDKGDDNFLQNITTNRGDKYFLLVNNFNSQKGFTLFFDGSCQLKENNDCLEEINSFNLFPNPATDMLELSFIQKVQNLSYTIFTNKGEKVISERLENEVGQFDHLKISIQHLRPGNYYLRIVENQSTTLKKFIKI